MLAVLLLCPNEVVPADELIKRAWPDGGSIGTLRNAVMRLRAALGEANCVRTVGTGYVAEPEDLDLLKFRELCEQGRPSEALRNLGDSHHASGNHERARQVWQRSLALYEHVEDSAADSGRERLTAWSAVTSSG